MTKAAGGAGGVLRALSPKRQRSASRPAEPSGPSATRQGSRTLFSRRHRPQQLPDLEKTPEEFEREWGITKAEEVRQAARWLLALALPSSAALHRAA